MEFSPNRSKKLLRIPFVFSWALISAGLFILIVAFINQCQNNPGMPITGGSIFAAGLLLYVILRFLITPINVHYAVSSDGITLSSFRKNLVISFNEIESVAELKGQKAEELLLKVQNQMIEKVRANRSLGGGYAFAEQMKARGFYRFLSVVPIFYSSGAQRGPRMASRVSLSCDCVFILLKNKEAHLISPVDVTGFVNEAKKYLPA